MELRSGKNEMLSIDFDARGISISSLHGALGLAQDRGLNDHLAHVGQNSDCIGNGKFFIVALGSASQRSTTLRFLNKASLEEPSKTP